MKKLLCLLMTAVLLLSTIAVTFHAAEVDRVDEGANFEVADEGADVDVAQIGNPYPTTQNVDGDGYYEVPCTRFAWQQAYDRLGISLPGWGDAVNWWQGAKNSGYATGSTPQPESIAVWKGDYYGHVAYVTSVSGGNTFTVNEGGRTDLDHTNSHGIAYGYTLTNAVGASRPYDTGKTLLGFIYLNGGKSGINVGDDFYALILNRPNWVTIGQVDNANVQVIHESKSTYDRTLWHFTRVNDRNAYKVISLFNGKGLDVSGASGEARANVQCWPYDGNSAQLWYFQQNTGSYYLTADCTSMMMDMDNGDPSNGTNIHMYNQNSTAAQQFTIYTVSTSNKLNYNITAGSTKIDAGGKTTVTVGGTLDYVYNYKFHIIKPDGTEQVVDNKCNNVLNFAPDDEGEYKVYAEIKNPLYTEKGSATNKAVTINVGCAHSFSEKFVEAAADGQQGYILRTCSICGKVFKDNYMDYKDGWYTPANGKSSLPDLIKNNDKYTKQYHNYSEKIQTDSPGAGWVNKGIDHREYVNDGESYESQWELSTSNTRVLLYDYYYHFCIPGAGINSEANYEIAGNFSHYDSVSSSQVSVVWTGDDNGHTAYVLHWSDGSTVYCQSGTTCDGAWGTHGQRSKAWYKMYVYQNKKEVIYYKWVKDSGWTDLPDSSADKTTVRFQANADPKYLGDANGDGDVDSVDATIVQRAATRIQVPYSEEQLMCADIDGDGALTIVDATFIQRYDSRISVPYPVGEAK